jgi:hypothetical protein
MPNRARPRCPACGRAMSPVFRKGARGKAFVRVPDTFHCLEDDKIAHGRRNVQFA